MAPIMNPPPRANSGTSGVPDSGGNDALIREMGKLRQMNDRLNAKADGIKQNPGKGGNKGGGCGKGGNDNKRARGSNDNYSNHGQSSGYSDNRRIDSDGRHYVKVRKGTDSQNYRDTRR
jgi:hypothetical protein